MSKKSTVKKPKKMKLTMGLLQVTHNLVINSDDTISLYLNQHAGKITNEETPDIKEVVEILILDSATDALVEWATEAMRKKEKIKMAKKELQRARQG